MELQQYSNCGRWNHDYLAGICQKCRGEQNPKKEVKSDYWAGYLLRFEKREKPRTEVEEMVLPHISKFNWTNETLEKDLSLFWMACHKLWKQKPTLFKEVLTWASTNNIHPRAWLKTVNKRCMTKTGTATPKKS